VLYSFVGVRVNVAPCSNKIALRKKLTNLHTKSQISDPDEEYICFIGSETLPYTCYILSVESSIPDYSTSKPYPCGRA